MIHTEYILKIVRFNYTTLYHTQNIYVHVCVYIYIKSWSHDIGIKGCQVSKLEWKEETDAS